MTEKQKKPRKKEKGGKVNALIHGKQSEILKDIKKRIDVAPLTAVQKIEFENMIQEISARAIAYDVDSYVNQILIDKIKATNPQVVQYETDLYATQGKLADLEKDIQFNRKVMGDLKEEYLRETDDDKKRQILEDIDLRDEAIKKSQRLYQQYMELRNKIRKEVDKKDFMKKQTELKEKAMDSNVIDVDGIVLD